MKDQELNKAYSKAIRARGKSGARWQKTKEVSGKDVTGETSPYRNYVGAGKEPDLAVGQELPRNFSVLTAIRNEEIEAEVKGRVRKLMDLAKQILTEQQYKVFILLAVKEPALTEREIGKVLGISHGRVNQLWKAARQKLEKGYETRTH